MPLDPTFQTTAGVLRFREIVSRENRARILHGAKPSEAAQKFLAAQKREKERSKAAQSQINTGKQSDAGARGQAGRSGVKSCTQRHVVDEGYDMVLKTEWGAATEGINSQDPIFRELNDGTIGEQARSLHNQREESARRVTSTRKRLEHEKEVEAEWAHRAHQIVEDGWSRARTASLGNSRGLVGGPSSTYYEDDNSAARHSDYSTIATEDHLYRKQAPEVAAQNAALGWMKSGSSNKTTDAETGEETGVPKYPSAYISTSTNPHKHGHGLCSTFGVRAPTFTKERHENLTRRVRHIYDAPPKPQKDIFAALEHITKSNLPKKRLAESAAEEEQKDRQELAQRVDALKRELQNERHATTKMEGKLEQMKTLASSK